MILKKMPALFDTSNTLLGFGGNRFFGEQYE